MSAIQNKQDNPVADEELEELRALDCISLYEPSKSVDDVGRKIADLKSNYDTTSDIMRNLNKELLGVEHGRAVASGGTKLAMLFGLDSGKKRISTLKHEMAEQEKVMAEIKQQLLETGLEKETIERAVKIDGHRAIISPNGEQFVHEISAREPYMDRQIGELKHVLEQLDLIFSTSLAKIESMNTTNTVPSIWTPYFVSLELNMSSYDMSSFGTYDSIDNDLMDFSNAWLLRNISPQNNATALAIQERIDSEIRTKASITHASVDRAITIIARMLAAWSTVNYADDPSLKNVKIVDANAAAGGDAFVLDPDQYMANLGQLLDHAWQELSHDKNLDKDDMLAILLLAFASDARSFPWTKNFEFFQEMFKDIPEGKNILCAIAALFPWAASETWMVLLRAESNILRGQRAKFVPELIEYAVLLAMNPAILAIENSISLQQLAAWRYMIIPAIQAVIMTGMEDYIYSYIQSRPMSYITSPYYYRRHHGYIHTTTLHYHTTG